MTAEEKKKAPSTIDGAVGWLLKKEVNVFGNQVIKDIFQATESIKDAVTNPQVAEDIFVGLTKTYVEVQERFKRT